MTHPTRTRSLVGALVVIVLIIGVIVAYRYRPGADQLPPFVASGNGRIEATEVDIATRLPGRLESVMIREGDMVEADQPVARMDTDELEANLSAAQANLRQAIEAKRHAEAVVTQRIAELRLADAELRRMASLVEKGHVSREQVDQSQTSAETAKAALRAAQVQVESAQAGIEAAEASIQQVQTSLDDSLLTTPVGGRVLYKLAEPGEILASGGKIATVLDVTDVYMTIFLPTGQAGKVRVGSDARIILDAIPDYVIPASVSFVAAEAQFTPKAVETRAERDKLMFRVRIRIDPELLNAYRDRVKTGVPGEAYIKIDDQQPWPDTLEVNLPNA
ncbi:HlyD family efflux transporter periplasmic adaptor subunit [Marinobacter nanhaiticus D15-8W]|uniref:HlyD family efflux transporter periplasmic adaptor subunit n=1 Tax=Marinobacter nanhaiticus D15-8W TaxID=626887 RepID=N6WQC3_9GAMM|nr:HlyD family efflux transporter periplasmic adaptor subunit [Marinobacter nanhaiticus]ENO13227.1 HlyD family efflux transporter periplasmic adaptor subunit [Marinobacter nanhaiticus D15-8W]BES70588.1 HlyD family efflux transporter periplasmic adaptor subunit [Marinobacter nanhaiticus D15-8W]